MKRLVSAVFFAVLLASCASSHVLVGKQRPEISADQVQVYLQPPAKYEQVAMLEADSRASFAVTSQGKTNKVIERLKAEAASLGANGILLQGVHNQNSGTVGTTTGSVYGNSYTGTTIGAPVNLKAGTAIAIYVEP